MAYRTELYDSVVLKLGCGLRPPARGFDSRVFDAVWEAEDGEEDGGNLQKRNQRNQESRPKGLRGTALKCGLGSPDAESMSLTCPHS